MMTSTSSTSKPRKLYQVTTPAFIVNRHTFRENCELARTYALANGICRLRPHIKTHKTKEGCLLQAGIGGKREDKSAEVIGFVASTIPELEMLVEMACDHEGKPFHDILYGMPICYTKLPIIHRLKDKLTRWVGGGDGVVHVLVDSEDQLERLEDFVATFGSALMNATKWSVFLKIDTGYHRAGVTCDLNGVSLAAKIINSSHVSLKGVYSHCGHSYNSSGDLEMKKIAHDDQSVILQFLRLLSGHLASLNNSFDINLLDISVGSTPTMFSHDKLNVPNNVELHPGNYVFYDRQQLYTGACEDEDSIAGFVLARVIGQYKDADRNAIMVDAGATALTKDVSPQGDVCAVYGMPELECYRMSQETTMIRLKDGGSIPFPFEGFPLGTTLLLIPNHSCLAAACFDVYHVVDDDQIDEDSVVVDTWKPVKGWA